MQWGKTAFFSPQKQCENNRISTCKKNWSWYSSPHHTQKLTQMIHTPKFKHKNYKTLKKKTIKLLREKHRNNSSWLWKRQWFLRYDIKKHTCHKKKSDKLNFIIIKNFCVSKDTINKGQRQLTEWEKTCANRIADKRLDSRKWKMQQKRQQIAQLKNGPRIWKTFLHRRLQMDDKHIKRCLTSLGNCKSCPRLGTNSYPLRWLKF